MEITSDKKINEMHLAIVGNEDLGIKGIVDQVQDNTSDINKIKKAGWVATGVVTSSGIGAAKYLGVIGKLLALIGL